MQTRGAEVQKSVFQKALGPEFERLHPEIRRQYSIHSESAKACIGRGVMERVWHGPFYTWPFLYLGSLRRVMFLESGRDVPFSIENFAYRDGHGRETFTWIRRFEFPRVRQFDEWVIFSERRQRLLIYAGTRQHLGVEATASVDEAGRLRIQTGIQRIFWGPLTLRYPLAFSASADVREAFNERSGCFEIEVHVANRFWGPIFGCRGRFQVEWLPCPTDRVPGRARPEFDQPRE